jgi:hypothetical protein
MDFMVIVAAEFPNDPRPGPAMAPFLHKACLRQASDTTICSAA